MKKILIFTLLTIPLFAQSTIQKDKNGKISNGPVTVGSGNTLTIAAGGTLTAEPGSILNGIGGGGGGSGNVNTSSPLTGGNLVVGAGTFNIAPASIPLSNVIVSSSTYANPTWLTSLAAGKVTGLAASATVDTTNAGNISSGILAPSRLTVQSLTPGDFGSSTLVPVLTVDSHGIITGATQVAISGAGGGNVNSGGALASGNIVTGAGSTNVQDGGVTIASLVPAVRTVNGHALSGNVTVTQSDVGLSAVTNDAQTKAAVVPNTTPLPGRTLVGNAGGTAYAPVAISGDAALASTGALTVTKTNGVSFATSATTDTTNAGNITSGFLPAARMPALTGDITSSAGSVATTLTNTAVTAGTYGDATHVGAFTVDAKGRLTAASSVVITGAGGTGNVTAPAALTSANLIMGQGNTTVAVATGNVSFGGNLTITGTFAPAAITWGSSVVPAANGGAGTVSGLLKANGSGTVTAATAGTDYATPSAGNNTIQLSNGAGGFGNVTVGTGLNLDATTHVLTATGNVTASRTGGESELWPSSWSPLPTGFVASQGQNGVPAYTEPSGWDLITYFAGTVGNVTFSPPAGTVSSGTAVTLSSSPGGVTINYTTDGSTPTRTHGTTGTSVTVSSSETVKAVGFLNGYLDGPVTTAAYTVAAPTLTSATIPTTGVTMSLLFDQSVSIGSGGNAGFVPTLTGGASAMTYVSGSGSTTLVYSLGRTVNTSETGTLAYTQPGNGVEATTGGADVVTFSGASITNNSTQGGGTTGWLYNNPTTGLTTGQNFDTSYMIDIPITADKTTTIDQISVYGNFNHVGSAALKVAILNSALTTVISSGSVDPADGTAVDQPVSVSASITAGTTYHIQIAVSSNSVGQFLLNTSGSSPIYDFAHGNVDFPFVPVTGLVTNHTVRVGIHQL